MKQKIHAMATALGFFKQKAESLRLKAVGEFSKKQLTNRLSLRPIAQADASLITMTGEGGEAVPLRQKAKSLRQKAICWMDKIVGQFRQKQSTNRLSLRPNAQAEASLITMTGEGGEAVPLRQKAKSLRQKAICWMDKIVGQFRQKQSTNRLSLRPSAQAEASLITMTAEGEAMQLKRSVPKSNDHSLTENSALAVAVKLKKFLHFHCSKWRSGEFLGTFCGKKYLAIPPAMRREDSQSKESNSYKEIITTPFNSPVRQLTEVHWVQTYRVENELKQGIRQFSKKLLTNRLSLHPGAQTDASLITIMAKRRGIAVKLRPNILMALLIVMVVIIGTTAKAQIQTKALQIGDTIPEAVWNTPLQIVNHPEGKSSIRLGDYKGKLIILDFWATWCVSCVKSFPEEGRLQKEFEDRVLILPVTTQKQSIVSAFMQRDNPTKGSPLTVVTDDQLLSSTFKHQLMPHVVWIDGKGRFIASTAASYVQAEKIQQVLRQQKLNWTMKRDFLEFDKTDALMGWMDHGGTAPEIFGYSAFTGHLWGVDTVSGHTGSYRK